MGTLYANTASNVCPANTSENTIDTYSVASLGATDKLGIELLFKGNPSAANASVATAKVYFGGVLIAEQLIQKAQNMNVQGECSIIAANSTSAQKASGNQAAAVINPFGGTTTPLITTALDTTVAQNLSVTIQLGIATDVVSLEEFRVIQK